METHLPPVLEQSLCKSWGVKKIADALSSGLKKRGAELRLQSIGSMRRSSQT